MLWLIKKMVRLVFIDVKQEKWPGPVGVTAGRAGLTLASSQRGGRPFVSNVVMSTAARLFLGRGACG